MQFEKYIKFSGAETKLSKEFLKKFIYFKIDKHDYWFVITQRDKDYLNQPEVTLEYLMRPQIKTTQETELK